MITPGSFPHIKTIGKSIANKVFFNGYLSKVNLNMQHAPISTEYKGCSLVPSPWPKIDELFDKAAKFILKMYKKLPEKLKFLD